MKPRFWSTSEAAAEHYMGIRWPRAIWQAVLEQAIRDIVEGPSLYEMRGMTLSEMRRMKLQFEEAARQWVDDTVNEPRRFEWVCEQLGLEPSAVRSSIGRRAGT